MPRQSRFKQGCGLREISRSQKFSPNYEILGAQHLSLYEKKKKRDFPVAQSQKLVACGTPALLEHSPVQMTRAAN